MKLLLSSTGQTVTRSSTKKPSRVKSVCTESTEMADRFALKTSHSQDGIFRSLSAVREDAESFEELTRTTGYC